ncbi:MAG: glutamate N-acetyltransferase / amino-acid N-acetyltransferase, partial [Halothiobacillaceae bacterium]
MALSSQQQPSLVAIDGIRLATVCAGMKVANRRDLVVMELAPATTCAAVFTQNDFCAAPVQLAKRHLAASSPRYLVINTGNANAGMGEQGLADALQSCQALAELAGCQPTEVLPFSTGVIGERLPIAKLLQGLPTAVNGLSSDGWEDAAVGIMT